MYNTVEKALGELVANAYDADARRVDVSTTGGSIVVKDTGSGMSPTEVQEFYLRIGRDRRAHDDDEDDREKTDKGRAIIGNKGIGKLAGLGIAETMIVTTQKGRRLTTIRIEREELDARDSLEDVDLHPEIKVVSSKATFTEIRLEGLIDDIADVDEDELRTHLATEMPAAADFTIRVNGTEATAEDIKGDRYEIDDTIEGVGRVRGFYKIVAKRSQHIAPGFAVRVRERIVQPRSLFGLNQQTHGFFVVTRIVGELRPDFIDPLEDREASDAFAINTSRTGLNPESPKVEALIDYAREKLHAVADGESKKRNAKRKAAAYQRNPEIEARMQRLAPDVYKKLDGAIDQIIETLSKNERLETVDAIVDIVIRYYESTALKALVDAISDSDDADVERLAELLAQFGSGRLADLAELLWFQLTVISSLESSVRRGALEAEIHKVIADNIWLVRESLQYWFDNKQFSTQLGDSLASEFKWAKQQRPDLVCYDNSRLNTGGDDRLLVIEFKRPGVEIGSDQLAQVMLYKAIFTGSLTKYPTDKIDVWILADGFSTGMDRKALESSGYFLRSYVELLSDARGRYADFYETLVPDGSAPPHPGVVVEAGKESEDDEVADAILEPGARVPRPPQAKRRSVKAVPVQRKRKTP